MLIGVGVSGRISYPIVIDLFVSCSGSITSVGEEREREREREICCYRLLVIMWFLLGGVSSSSWCLG